MNLWGIQKLFQLLRSLPRVLSLSHYSPPPPHLYLNPRRRISHLLVRAREFCFTHIYPGDCVQRATTPKASLHMRTHCDVFIPLLSLSLSGVSRVEQTPILPFIACVCYAKSLCDSSRAHPFGDDRYVVNGCVKVSRENKHIRQRVCVVSLKIKTLREKTKIHRRYIINCI